MRSRVPELSAGGFCFRPWRDVDAPAVLELARDPSAWQWMATLRLVDDLDSALRWVRGRHDADRVDWVVCDPATGAVVGRVGLHHFDDVCRSAEIGYVVWPRHRGRSLAAVMVARGAEHAFTGMGLARVSLKHATGNPASCAVAARAGFAFEGVERSAHDHGDGVLHDLHRHARLADDPPGPAAPAPVPLTPVGLDAGELSLRPWEPTDVEAALAGLSDPLVARWDPRLPLPSLGAARAWVAGRAQRWADGRAATWAVTDGGAVVGSVALRDINRIDSYAVASYWTLPSARGRGVAGRALARVTAYAVEELGLHRVQLAHAVANGASCRVAEKAGFSLEGILRGSNRLTDGFVDEHLHARLADDP